MTVSKSNTIIYYEYVRNMSLASHGVIIFLRYDTYYYSEHT